MSETLFIVQNILNKSCIKKSNAIAQRFSIQVRPQKLVPFSSNLFARKGPPTICHYFYFIQERCAKKCQTHQCSFKSKIFLANFRKRILSNLLDLGQHQRQSQTSKPLLCIFFRSMLKDTLEQWYPNALALLKHGRILLFFAHW